MPLENGRADERVSRGQASERAVCVCEAVSVEMGARRPPLPTAVVCPPGRRRRLRLAITAVANLGPVRNPVRSTNCRYGEAPAAAASWRAHDGSRQGTACPLLYRYRHTHTYCSLARLPPTHPFVGAPILQRHFQVRWRARLPPPRVLLPHTYTQDGWFLQPERRPARLPRRTIFSRCICRCSRMRARLPLHILLHTQVSR